MCACIDETSKRSPETVCGRPRKERARLEAIVGLQKVQRRAEGFRRLGMSEDSECDEQRNREDVEG